MWRLVCPFVGTRRNQGKVQRRLSASHLPHLVVLCVLTGVPLALGMLRSPSFQGTYRKNTSV